MFQWRRFAIVWITWTTSSAILATISERDDTFLNLFLHGVKGDKLGKSYLDEFASMMIADQLRQLSLFFVSNLAPVRTKLRWRLPPAWSFWNTMDLREADNVYMTFFLATTGAQVFFMAFDREYQGHLGLASFWDSSAVTAIIASISVKSLLYVGGLAAIHLARKIVVAALHAKGWVEGPPPKFRSMLLDWYNNNILLRALVQQTGEMILSTLEWLIVKDPMTRAREYTRKLRFRYNLKQARRRVNNADLINRNLVRIENEDEVCLVCFGEMPAGHLVPRISCGHKVHGGCWLSVLTKGDGKCPQPGCTMRPTIESIIEQSSREDIQEALEY